MRGGFDDRNRGGFDDRNRGGFDDRTRGGFEDRSRGGFDDRRGERKGRESYQGDSRVNDDFRGSGRGRGRGGRGGREERENKRQTEAVKPDDLAEDVNTMVLKDSEGGGGGKGPMRYSQQRRAGSGVSDNTSASSSLQEMYAEGIDPSLCSGPPSAPPFQNQQMSASRLGREGREGSHPSSHPAVTQSNLAGNFIGANQAAILNYSPQFPVGPVVTPSSLGIAGPVVTSGLPLNALANTILPGADPLMIQDNFADVRGGVTYFNPTAQNFLPQRQVTKRAKAPIAIVDPSQKGDPAAKDYNSVNNRSLPGESNLTSENNQELTAAQ